jgi:thiamine monophosphate synthase
MWLVSPVFDPSSKPPERPAIGVDGFMRFAATTSLPCFALGGITAERARHFSHVAVIGEVMHSARPAHAAEALLRALE